MKIKAVTKALVASFLVAGIGGTTLAHAGQGYVGFGFGNGASSDWCNIDNGACDDSDTGFKFFGGARLSESVAAEAIYTSFGTVSDFGYPGVDLSSLTFSAVGMLPLSPQFNLLGKLGIAFWEADAGGSISNDGSDLAFGIGAQIKVDKKLAIRGEWEQIQGTDVNFGELTLVSVSALYYF